MAQSTTVKPVKVFRARGISASVFENQTHADGQPVVFFKVNLQRTFVQNNQYRHNSSFSRDDIPVAIHVLHEAWQFVLQREAASTAESSQAQPSQE